MNHNGIYYNTMIDKIPDSIILKIFSYLDKGPAPMFCRRWWKVISKSKQQYVGQVVGVDSADHNLAQKRIWPIATRPEIFSWGLIEFHNIVPTTIDMIAAASSGQWTDKINGKAWTRHFIPSAPVRKVAQRWLSQFDVIEDMPRLHYLFFQYPESAAIIMDEYLARAEAIGAFGAPSSIVKVLRRLLPARPEPSAWPNIYGLMTKRSGHILPDPGPRMNNAVLTIRDDAGMDLIWSGQNRLSALEICVITLSKFQWINLYDVQTNLLKSVPNDAIREYIVGISVLQVMIASHHKWQLNIPAGLIEEVQRCKLGPTVGRLARNCFINTGPKK